MAVGTTAGWLLAGKIAAGVLMAGSAGLSAKQALTAKDDQKGPKELETKAAREAEKRRLASAGKLSTQGETMFTTPIGIQGGIGGTQLKGKLGQ